MRKGESKRFGTKILYCPKKPLHQGSGFKVWIHMRVSKQVPFSTLFKLMKIAVIG